MIRLGLAVLTAAIPLSVSANVSNELSPSRMVTVTGHTAPGAHCSLSESVSGIQRRATASRTGRVTWRWRPSVWANGADTLSITCAKGGARQSTESFLVIGKVLQIRVIRHFALHLVYWGRGIPTSAIARFESDVKTSLDAGATNNPFAIPRAYGDSLGPGDPRIASVDATVDSDPFPAPAEGYCWHVTSPCVGRPDIEAEIARLARRHGWAAGNRTLIMLFTGPSLTVCHQAQPCTRPCGFHGLTSAGYAFADVIMASASDCGGKTAEYAIAVAAHEQNEAIVDPFTGGLEVADKCEGDFKDIPVNGHAYRLPAIVQNGRCAFAYTR